MEADRLLEIEVTFGFGFNFGRNNRGEDTVIDLSLTLEDVISGKNETIEVPSLEKCSVCNGSGCYPGTKTQEIYCVMDWDKRKEYLAKIDFRLLLLWKRVELAEESERLLKNHVKIVRQQVKLRLEKIQIEIPSGIDDGMTLQLSGRGISDGNEIPGDLFIRIHIKPHQIFERLENGDLLYSLKLKYTELVLVMNNITDIVWK